ncbi:hypothetical protein [Shewanella colwelliana]|uniref:hypothetical protein n=1 Tax=Shewanella colwelliana TaxID=23 RepID=UPI00299D3900|nr:hypothetical protein [Shewanella colwelliana]MDX1282695.1 hypothetical protein [Shewanella colwelliana]
MTNKVFLTIPGVIYAVFAVVLFFLPQYVWPMYGVELNDQYAYFLSQHTSIFLGGLAAVTILLRDIASGEVAKKLMLALVIANGLGALITLYAGGIGIFSGFGWSDPLFFSVLSVLSLMQYKNNRSAHYP